MPGALYRLMIRPAERRAGLLAVTVLRGEAVLAALRFLVFTGFAPLQIGPAFYPMRAEASSDVA